MGGRTLEKVDLLKRGDLSPVENVQRFLERIEKEDKKINSFLEINPRALEEAEAVERKIKAGEDPGKLAGLAIAVKANINVEGLHASCASKTLENYVSPYD
ncbi:MAG: amidase family protein, partial [Candidatus Hadarchaeales archaeon]